MLLKQMEEFNSELIDEIRDIVNKGKKVVKIFLQIYFQNMLLKQEVYTYLIFK